MKPASCSVPAARSPRRARLLPRLRLPGTRRCPLGEAAAVLRRAAPSRAAAAATVPGGVRAASPRLPRRGCEAHEITLEKRGR